MKSNMSERKKTKIITTSTSQAKPTHKRTASRVQTEETVEMLFKKKNFYFVFGGLVLMALGFILMAGGKMPSPEVWDASLIYSFRIVFIAPLVILIGLGLNIYAVFTK